MNKWKVRFYLILLSVFISCSRYNEMASWTDNIPQGTSVDSVKQTTPTFIEIDWENPHKFDDSSEIYFIKMKWHYDVLKMSYYLSFKNNKYVGQFAQK